MARPGPWDIKGSGTSLADALRAQADNQAKQAERKKNRSRGGGGNAAPNPLDQLMEQIQSINVEATPIELLMQQARGSAGAQYNPLIKELEAQMGATKRRAKGNKKEAKAMYSALAGDIDSETPQIVAEQKAAQNEAKNRYREAQQEIGGQYDRQAREQAQVLKQLGIQAAAPEASQQQVEDEAYFKNQIASDKNADLDMLKEMYQADRAYNRETADTTRLAGVNAAGDIQAQLEDYLQTAGGKLAGYRAGKSSAIEAMMAQLQQEDAERVTEAEENEYDRLMDMFNLQLKMQEAARKAQMAASDAGGLFKGTNGPSGMSNYLGEMYPNDRFSRNSISDAINDVMAHPDVIAGRVPAGEDAYGKQQSNAMTDEYMIDLLRRRMNEGDLKDSTKPNALSGTDFSNSDVNNAINALLAYLGKLK